MPASYHLDPDVAIVGSGFAGALTALVLRRRGRSVVLLERGRHPRFAIGESSTPLANLLLEELADRYDLPRVRAVLEVGHVAAAVSGRRLRPEARLQLLPPRSGRGLRRRARSRPPAARRREPARRDRRHALVSARLRSLPGARGRGRGGDPPRRDDARAAPPSKARARSSKAADRAARCACAHDSWSTRAGRAASSSERWTCPRRRRGGCLRPKVSIPTSRTSRAGTRSVPPWARRPIRSTTPRCITFSPAVGSGCSGSRTASRARARPGHRARRATCGSHEGEAAWERLLAQLPSVRAQFDSARPVHPFVYTPRVGVRDPRASSARAGRCFRRRPASSIPCSRPASR